MSWRCECGHGSNQLSEFHSHSASCEKAQARIKRVKEYRESTLSRYLSNLGDQLNQDELAGYLFAASHIDPGINLTLEQCRSTSKEYFESNGVPQGTDRQL